MATIKPDYKDTYELIERIGDNVGATGPEIIEAVIDAGGTISSVIDTERVTVMGIIVPLGWTAANLTFQASNTPDIPGEWFNVYDDTGVEVTVIAAANRAIAIDFAALKLAPWRYLRVRSGTSATPVAQAAARTLILIGKV